MPHAKVLGNKTQYTEQTSLGSYIALIRIIMWEYAVCFEQLKQQVSLYDDGN